MNEVVVVTIILALVVGIPYAAILSIVIFAVYFKAKLKFHQDVLEQLKTEQEEVK